MATVDLFECERARLFGLAYRMLGSAADAEDMVQDAFLRWREVDVSKIQSPKAYLSTIVARKCIDRLRSLKTRREDYVGPWLPEPLITTSSTPEHDALLAESISMAFMVLLERLSPVERAAFLLRDVFAFSYDHIATIIGKSTVNCRQICRRARERVAAERPRFDSSAEHQLALTGQFLMAVGTGDLAGLVSLLAQDVTVWSDGGGKVAAARFPIHGPDRTARFVLGVARKFMTGMSVRPALVNGQPGLISASASAVYAVTALDITDGVIAGIRIVRNPDKLCRIALR